MEIEAKFSFRDATAFAGWRERPAAGPFALGHARLRHTLDEYLDTIGRELELAGYACRVRVADGRVVATLKSLADASLNASESGAADARRREEYEVELTAGAGTTRPESVAAGATAPEAWQPDAWPEGEARTLALRLAEGQPLCYLTTIRQERYAREVKDGTRLVAELSLDRVWVADDPSPSPELEVELQGEGDERDLDAIVTTLRDDPALAPEARSKLQRALQRLPPPPLTLRRLVAVAPGKATDRRVELVSQLLDGLGSLAETSVPLRSVLPATRLLTGSTENPCDAAATARDLLLAQPLADLEDAEQRLLAAALGLQSMLLQAARDGNAMSSLKRKRARRDPAFATLSRAEGDAARRLAAVLHLATSIEQAASDDSAIAAITSSERRLTLTFAGPEAGHAASAVTAAAPLWKQLFDLKLTAEVTTGGEPERLGLRFDQSLAEAGRTVMRAQLERLQAGVETLREGDDAEALHDTRVAVRRLCTALQVLKRVYPRRTRKRLQRELERAGDRLGAVRDLDVLLETAHDERQRLADGAGLDELVATWEQQRDEKRRRLHDYIKSAHYAALVEQLTAFLSAAPDQARGSRGGRRVCEALPERVWGLYGAVRAYQPRVAGAGLAELHELRKELKRLRYLLEFFRELLGPDVENLIDRVVAAQDALGTVHDHDVLRGLLEARLAEQPARPRPGVGLYLERTLATIGADRRAFLELWPALVDRKFRRALGVLVAGL